MLVLVATKSLWNGIECQVWCIAVLLELPYRRSETTNLGALVNSVPHDSFYTQPRKISFLQYSNNFMLEVSSL